MPHSFLLFFYIRKKQHIRRDTQPVDDVRQNLIGGIGKTGFNILNVAKSPMTLVGQLLLCQTAIGSGRSNAIS